MNGQHIPNEPRKITHAFADPLDAATAAWPVSEDATRPFAEERPAASKDRLVEPTRSLVLHRLEDVARKPVKPSMGRHAQGGRIRSMPVTRQWVCGLAIRVARESDDETVLEGEAWCYRSL
jgi:hypothetical protein